MSGKRTLLFHKLDLSSRPWVQLSVCIIFRQTCTQQTEVSVFDSPSPAAFHKLELVKQHIFFTNRYFFHKSQDLCVMCCAMAMEEVMTPAIAHWELSIVTLPPSRETIPCTWSHSAGDGCRQQLAVCQVRWRLQPSGFHAENWDQLQTLYCCGVNYAGYRCQTTWTCLTPWAPPTTQWPHPPSQWHPWWQQYALHLSQFTTVTRHSSSMSRPSLIPRSALSPGLDSG